MRIGDLVKYCGNGQLYVVTEITLQSSTFIRIMNVNTGKFSQMPPHWLTKIKTDIFCP